MSARWRLVALTAALAAVVATWHGLDRRDDVLGQLWAMNQQHVVELREKLAARPDAQVDGRLALGGDDDLATPPRAEPTGGRFGAPVRVRLATRPGQWVHYTLDGSVPTRRSPRYEGPFTIGRTTVVRCRSFGHARFGSDTVTHTYFVGEAGALPVVSLVADPMTLWNKYAGIYANPRGRGRAWERDASIEYYDADGKALRFATRLRIHGNISRMVRKKAFRLLFDGGAVAGDADSAVLRAGRGPREVILRQGGSNVKFRLQDELFCRVYRHVGGLASAAEPVVVFINGEYWGLYNLRERINAALVRRHAAADAAALATREGVLRKVRWKAVVGDPKVVRRELKALDPRNDLDLEAFLDYWLVNVYAANNDWPHYNQYVWRDHDGPWRPIAWDADAAFLHVDHDTLAWATRAELRHELRHNYEAGLKDLPEFLDSTRWLRELMKDPAFADAFQARMLALLEGPLHPDKVGTHFDALVALTDRAEVKRDLERWGYTEDEYRAQLERIRRFIRDRPTVIRSWYRG